MTYSRCFEGQLLEVTERDSDWQWPDVNSTIVEFDVSTRVIDPAA